MLGQVQHRIAEDAADLGLGRDEIGRAGRVQDVLVCAKNAFSVIAVQQGVRGKPVQHQFQLPRQIVSILQAGIGTACSERADLMRAVASKDHPVMA